MKVENFIKVYEIDRCEVQSDFSDSPQVKVSSHWIYDDRVVIKCGDGQSFTVLVKELEKAVRNASNHK